MEFSLYPNLDKMDVTRIHKTKLHLAASNLSNQLALTTAFIGLVVLIGWVFNLEFLKTLEPRLITMKVNTALGFIFSGISLWLWHQNNQQKQSSHVQLLSQVFAGLVVLVGLLTLIQYGFNINLGIDQLLIKEDINAVDTYHPGRMAPNTALCFFWLGSALILLQYRLMSVAQSFAVGSFFTALFGLIGYLFGISSFYSLAPFTGMAVHTSVTFLLLGLGIILSSPENGWMQTVMSPYFGGVIARRLLPVVIGVPILSSGLFLSAYRSNVIPGEIGFLLRAIINIFVLGVVVWWNARYLNTSDHKYQNAQQALQEAYENLETKIHERTAQLEAANQALKDGRRQLSNLINTLPGIVFSRSVDDECLIHSLSDGYLSIIGCSRTDISSYSDRTLQDLIVPEDIPKIVAAIQIAIEQNSSYEIEYRIRTQCGEEKWLWEKGIETSIDGQIPTIQGFITEITSLKHTQEALGESEAKFRELAENIHEVFHINSADLSQILYISPGYEQIWRRSCQSLYQNPNSWSESIHPDDCDRILAACERLIQGEPLEAEYRIIRPQGEIRWIFARVFPIYSLSGTILRHAGIAADITERKLAEIAVQQSEERYRSLVEATAQVIWITDPHGQFITPQESWQAFTGQSFLEYQGWNWQYAIHPEDRERTKQAWSKALQKSELFENECRIQSKNGEYRYFWVRAVPVLKTDGSNCEWVGTCTDITNRKQAEREIQELNEQLETRVQQRTAQLTAANKELEAFSYSVSHDLRAPLRGLDGFSKTLLERYQDQLDDKGKHYLTRIRAGTQRMGELIDDLLQLSRVTRSQMRHTQLNLSAIAQEIAQELSESNPERQVEWLISPHLTVTGDPRLLRIVMENLLNNAWKFTSVKIQSQIEFSCTASHNENGTNITYFVRDNGVGFNEVYVNKLFQPFQRLHTIEEFPGTGIGLATVQRVIFRHGGYIWANGVVGEGAIFHFTLPG
ncbi:PAS domain-containing protein [Anabaena cylindrica FACHB-243]|uniref:histidine kinase n=1 Tax=Anabaena cylindrica (strain ATCC 27899 / PCC 7122) TaxID=272123 RepID=K9ZKJ0_ANACC|nr:MULTISPECIES: PAS domain-containing protein [Anabaena]AFZ59082.1 multi-sensor signal transduction histidine kinase [Anabaena cylindrica PCC 7122]MBD2420579.1 PAS domain-containing protein [Anabaena cylindrica FACHB-243]MBY5284444.1 PAS domain-containing protein [Anabaena sp. CCAP 1446/1C]MBY5308991.1 PAS domain-containing protein [Anabaena sp. CCAP 1446/1C]MCM2408537.1 PAS domain-containing protein [Anabaena sp. CCAP 1446/1C]